MMNYIMKIGERLLGSGSRTYFIAELSANHNQDFEQAVKLVKAAKEAGADAVKLQTYTPDTMTIDSDQEWFRIGKGTIWEGKTLYGLYKEAYTPWEWQPKLKKVADDQRIHLFSTPFDRTAVDYLERMDVLAYKIASFELVDLPLIRYVAKTGKPMIMSTGMASLAEIDEAVTVARKAGCSQIALLKCTSAYPADPAEMNLRTIPHLSEAFGVPAGLSDHTLGIAVPIAAVAVGASVIEKHFTLTRSVPGPDSSFSLEPDEFKTMVDAIRTAEKSLGKVNYDLTEHETAGIEFRRSIFVVRDIMKGETFTHDNIRSIRPGKGLPPKYMDVILEKKARRGLRRGTPLSWEDVD